MIEPVTGAGSGSGAGAESVGRADAGADAASAPADRDVEAALAALARVDHLPVEEHPAVYDDIHRRLARILASTAGRPSPRPTRHIDPDPAPENRGTW